MFIFAIRKISAEGVIWEVRHERKRDRKGVCCGS